MEKFLKVLLALAIVVLCLWVLIIWLQFKGSPEELQTFATYGTALATIALAFGTFLMAFSSRQMAKEIRYERGQPRATEFVALILDPLIERVGDVKALFRERDFGWGRWPLKGRVDQVVTEDEVTRFQVTEKEEARYFVPYANIVVFEELYLAASRFEWRRQKEFRERYKRLSNQIQKYDGLAREFRLLLGRLANDIYSALTQSRALESLESRLRPYIVGIAFNQMALAKQKFDSFVSQFGVNAEQEKARSFYIENAPSIEQSLMPKKDNVVMQINKECNKLEKVISKIEVQLQKEREKLCEEFLISEIDIDSLRKSRNDYH
jgi:hypothetical protein